MKPIRWAQHAVESLTEREIDRSEAEATLQNPELVVPDPPAREVSMRRYFDRVLQKEMLMRVVVEQTVSETVVVTVYKTSQMERYMKEVQR
jgi:hypothetical protein